MSKHTPGPWNIAQESIDKEWHIVTASGGRIMANVHIEAGNEMDAANARLIAAAPDLLAACKDVARQANMNIDADDPDNWHLAEITRSAVELVFAAIAKAEGGAS